MTIRSFARMSQNDGCSITSTPSRCAHHLGDRVALRRSSTSRCRRSRRTVAHPSRRPRTRAPPRASCRHLRRREPGRVEQLREVGLGPRGGVVEPDPPRRSAREHRLQSVGRRARAPAASRPASRRARRGSPRRGSRRRAARRTSPAPQPASHSPSCAGAGSTPGVIDRRRRAPMREQQLAPQQVARAAARPRSRPRRRAPSSRSCRAAARRRRARAATPGRPGTAAFAARPAAPRANPRGRARRARAPAPSRCFTADRERDRGRRGVRQRVARAGREREPDAVLDERRHLEIRRAGTRPTRAPGQRSGRPREPARSSPRSPARTRCRPGSTAAPRAGRDRGRSTSRCSAPPSNPRHQVPRPSSK